jgi:hypothetical protein
MPETKEVVESLRTTKFAAKHAKLIGTAISQLESMESMCNELKQQLRDSIRDCEQLQEELREKVVCRSVYDRVEKDLMTLWRKQKSFSNARLQFFSFGVIAGVFVSIVIDFLFSAR